MLDNLHERDGDGTTGRENLKNTADYTAPVSDREVPIAPVATSDIVNRWLDGEVPEPTGLRGDAARSVEFWRRIGEETDRRRHMATPAHLTAQIMESLPQLEARTEAPWWKRPFQLTPAAMLAAAAGLLALGALLSTVLRVR